MELGGVSRSVLADRVRELRRAAVVTTDHAGRCRLTSEGTDLLEALRPLNLWATA